MMRKFSTTLSVLLFVANFSGAESYLERQEFMELQEAELRFGAGPFTPRGFKEASPERRAKMAVTLIKSKSYVGKEPKQVKEELGDFTGHFWNDHIPAYLIYEGWTMGKDTWQLVFLLNQEGKVNDVKIHKNCCPKN